MIHLIFLLHKAELFEPLLLWHGLIDEGARLLIWLTPSAADHTIDSTVQDIEALLDNVNITAINTLLLHAGRYNFHEAENMDGITKFDNKNRIKLN